MDKHYYFLVPNNKVKDLKNTMTEILPNGSKVKTPITVVSIMTSLDQKKHIYKVRKINNQDIYSESHVN
jgi:hypothetical protein